MIPFSQIETSLLLSTISWWIESPLSSFLPFPCGPTACNSAKGVAKVNIISPYLGFPIWSTTMLGAFFVKVIGERAPNVNIQRWLWRINHNKWTHKELKAIIIHKLCSSHRLHLLHTQFGTNEQNSSTKATLNSNKNWRFRFFCG